MGFFGLGDMQQVPCSQVIIIIINLLKITFIVIY